MTYIRNGYFWHIVFFINIMHKNVNKDMVRPLDHGIV